MTRGKFCLYEKDKIWTSCEFNGDMYWDGRGETAFLGITPVKTVEDLQELTERFNEKYFKYEEKMYLRDLTAKYSYAELLDMSADYIKKYFSDYIYMKNISGNTITFTDKRGRKIKLPNDTAGVIYFGEIADDVPAELNGFRVDDSNEAEVGGIDAMIRHIMSATSLSEEDARYLVETKPKRTVDEIYWCWGEYAEREAMRRGLLTAENHIYFDIDRWTDDFCEEVKTDENCLELPSGKIAILY